MKRLIEKILIVVAAMCSTVAMFADIVSTGNMSMALNGDGIPQLITFVILLIMYGRTVEGKNNINEWKLREKTGILIAAVLFSVFMVIGKAQIAHKDLKYGIVAVVLFAGYIPLFFLVLCYIGKFCENMSKSHADIRVGKITEWLFEKHVILGVMAVVFLCRLPYLIAFFPCSMTWDGGAQISNFYGLEPFTDHHPPLLSFLYGAVAWYSQEWGTPNVGMFLIPLLQTTLSAFAVAKTCKLFQYIKAPYWLRWSSLAYYALFTVWCIFDCTVIKDSLYYPLTMLFTIQVIYCILQREAFFSKKSNLAMLLIYGVLLTQVRNNGIFILIFILPFVWLVVPRRRKTVFAIAAIASLAVIMLLERFLYPNLGVTRLEVKEDVYCIMFQQTAKYGQDYPEDVTSEEREILDNIFDYDELVTVYNPQLADWVKNCLRLSEANSADHTNREFNEVKGDYFKVWFAQFRRHPLSYVNTFLECSYGWYYPEVRPYKEGVGFYEMDRHTFTEGMHQARQIVQLAPARFLLEQLGKMEYFPGIGLLYRCGFYTWCVLFVMVYAIVKRRYLDIIIIIPALVNILVCLISPVNTCIRYALPTMCMIPILCAIILREYKQLQ